jgi:branched-chain amino acid transport system ATP-binding protein
MLEVKGLFCGYGEVTVVHGLDLTVMPGEITALLGPNGAGKSSAIMAIAGHTQVSGGDILFDGRSILSLTPAERTRLGIAIVPEGRRVFPDLTVAENLLVGGYVRKRSEAKANEARVLALFPRLKDRHRQHAGTLSGGEQQMLAIARSLMSAPRLLLLDEPSLGLAPLVVDTVFDLIVQLKQKGLTVLLVEQNAERALEIADHGYVLQTGETALAGSGPELASSDLVKQAYLAE